VVADFFCYVKRFFITIDCRAFERISREKCKQNRDLKCPARFYFFNALAAGMSKRRCVFEIAGESLKKGIAGTA
jgi:hypothetical protein